MFSKCGVCINSFGFLHQIYKECTTIICVEEIEKKTHIEVKLHIQSNRTSSDVSIQGQTSWFQSVFLLRYTALEKNANYFQKHKYIQDPYACVTG